MKRLKLFEVKTDQGIIYLKREYYVENNVEFPSDKIYECFTNLECSLYYNYLKFYGGKKNLKFADLLFEDGTISTKEYSFKEMPIDNYKILIDNMVYCGINPQQYALDIINKGISEVEVQETLANEYKKEEKQNNIDEFSDYLDKFYRIFGDLFEEENKYSR